jgi:hypothetical protein
MSVEVSANTRCSKISIIPFEINNCLQLKGSASELLSAYAARTKNSFVNF